MNKKQKCLIWFFMFSKRLLHKLSFICLLCMIPIIIPLTNLALTEESGVLEIALCREDDSYAAVDAMEFLLEGNSVLHFVPYDSVEDAADAVKKHEINAVWVFKDNLDERISSFAAGKTREPFIEIIEREDTVLLQLAREVLYGSVFKEISYHLYKNYSYENLVSQDEVSEKEIKSYYTDMPRNNSVIELRWLNSDAPVQTLNHLTAPLRGILALVTVLATLAAAMYFLKDQSEGKYDWLSPKRRIIPAFASCLSAACFTGTATFIAICVSPISSGILNEIIPMLLFIIATTGFCLNFCIIFKSHGKLGAVIPGLMITMLALSPIFFNVTLLRPIRLMIPTYYYLYAINSTVYCLYMAIYCAGVYASAFILNSVLNKNGRKISIV